MTEKYKVGDLIFSDSGKLPDLAEITNITQTDITYKWLGLNDFPIYAYEMQRQHFDVCDFKIVPCNSEQQKLAIILKYS